MTNNSAIYRTAASLVNEGWAVGRGGRRGGKVCMLKAVAIAAGVKHYLDLPWEILQEIDSELVKLPAYCSKERSKRKRQKAIEAQSCYRLATRIYLWNDAIGREQDEVVEVLNSLAARLEQNAQRQEMEAMRLIPQDEVADDLSDLWAKLCPSPNLA